MSGRPGTDADDDEIELTEREQAVVRAAARAAVNHITDEFYRSVGRSVVTRAMVWLGVALFGFAAAKGWIVFELPGKH